MIGNFMENLPFILSGCVIGIIIFQTAVTAPAVFTVLSGQDASLFLRKIFPLFFLLIAFLSAVNAMIVVYDNQAELIPIPVASMILALLAYVLIPMTNRSRDNGDESRFKLLHRISVSLTLVILGCNVAFAAL
jgi:hypothetical protein